MVNEPNHECPSCAHRMFFEARSPVDVSWVVGCPGCGTAMYRMDALGAIERDLLPMANLRDEIEALQD